MDSSKSHNLNTDSSKISNYIKKTYIFDNINELPIGDRREILQIVYNSQFRSKLQEKGAGVQIKLEDLSQPIIDRLYTTIMKKLKEYTTDFPYSG
jgi:hypothetical protein